MTDREGPRSAAVLLHEIGDGALLALLSNEIQTVVNACQDYALAEGAPGTGEITLKLAFKAEKNGTCAVRAEVKSKAPRAKLPPAAMWISKGGNLLVENPRQKNLEFRDVNQRADVRELPNAKETAK
jgi:hypothetical protein